MDSEIKIRGGSKWGAFVRLHYNEGVSGFRQGQPARTHSIAAGLDYPGVGPEHRFYKDSGRVRYVAVTDKAALDAFKLLVKIEGIIPAPESAHAVAYAMKVAPTMRRDEIVIVNLSGRGDEDVAQMAALPR